jgi:hypothetical protein
VSGPSREEGPRTTSLSMRKRRPDGKERLEKTE